MTTRCGRETRGKISRDTHRTL